MRMRPVLSKIFLIYLAMAAANPVHSVYAKSVAGFSIQIRRAAPKADRIPFASAVSGEVLYLVGAVAGIAADPFASYPNLAGVSPYLAIQPGSSVKFIFEQSVTKLSLLWGSLDTNNFILFYDDTGTLIGTLSGDDLITAYGTGPFHTQPTIVVTSSVPFISVVLTANRSVNLAAFEFSNLVAQ